MTMAAKHRDVAEDALWQKLDKAASAIPPLWPLTASVAVNPYLGHAEEDLALTSTKLARAAGVRATMPCSWYREKMRQGIIGAHHLEAAWRRAPADGKPASLAMLQAAIAAHDDAPAQALPSMAQLAGDATGLDWPGLVTDCMGLWASGFFDEGLAFWPSQVNACAWREWKAFATHDLTPEIFGLRHFARGVTQLPDDALQSIRESLAALEVPAEAQTSYCHQLLLTLGGWSQYARYRRWIAEQAGSSDATLLALLAIRLTWEKSLYAQYRSDITARWRSILARHAEAPRVETGQSVEAILQAALEGAYQEKLARKLRMPRSQPAHGRVALQAIFCIDVRSEVFRRALESQASAIQTMGFAGFFGLAASYCSQGSDLEEKRLPVLLTPQFRAAEGIAAQAMPEAQQRVRARASRAWGRFTRAAVSSFAFVEAAGLAYAAKLLARVIGKAHADCAHAPGFISGQSLHERADAAERILRAMSLTEDFAPLVLIIGHGASARNNPHLSSLQCGACGGHAGDVSARLLASLLNDRAIRQELQARGIDLPDDTVFVAGLHNTTTDDVILFDADFAHDAADRIAQARRWLIDAGLAARRERSQRFVPQDAPQALQQRALDWAQVRPEWGLAGCRAFIAAPRHRTLGVKLDGQVFLHDYDAAKDESHAVLELVLTAPVVVASWISLQYYGSVVSPELFGSGRKVLHNVCGGIGVLEGNGGELRAGLPWESIHDGERLLHEPLRLTVCIEAAPQAISRILEKHPQVRTLFDQGWMSLFTLNERGEMDRRYAGALRWEKTVTTATPTSREHAPCL
jgi:uncharacterized protein YbcC (UPF0753/DUF2309 family)